MQDSIDDSARVSPAERTCDWAFRLALLLLIVVAPWPFGSVTPGPAAALTAALLLLGGAFLLTRIYFGRAYRTPGWHWLAAALALVALQQMPLPSSFSETTAPAIARDYEAARTVTGSGAWHPMSLEPFQTRSSFLSARRFSRRFLACEPTLSRRPRETGPRLYRGISRGGACTFCRVPKGALWNGSLRTLPRPFGNALWPVREPQSFRWLHRGLRALDARRRARNLAPQRVAGCSSRWNIGAHGDLTLFVPFPRWAHRGGHGPRRARLAL